MARFPFEEDFRFRFGGFHDLVPRYVPIGRVPPSANGRAAGRHSTPRGRRSRPPVQGRQRWADEFATHAGLSP